VTDSAASKPPRYVIDGWGNLWHHFNDTGYLRLLVTQDPRTDIGTDRRPSKQLSRLREEAVASRA